MRAHAVSVVGLVGVLLLAALPSCGDNSSATDSGGGGNPASSGGSGAGGDAPSGGSTSASGGDAGSPGLGGQGGASGWNRSGLDCSDWGTSCGDCADGSYCASSSPATCVPDPGGIVLICNPAECDGHCVAGYCLTEDQASCVCTGEAGAELDDCGGAGGECVAVGTPCTEGGKVCCGEATCTGAGVCLIKL